MKYSPASIQLRSAETSEYVSGMYIYDAQSGREAVISLGPHLGALVGLDPEAELFAALASGVGEEQVTWDKLVLVQELELPLSGIFFRKLEGFSHSPVEPPALQVFEFEDREPGQRKAERAFLRPLSLAVSRTDLISSTVRLLSCPFADTNLALFIGYQSQGVVSYVASDCSGMLLDARFLEDMAGAIVVGAGVGGRSLGLVYGQLTSSMGRGRLVTAVPWESILTVLTQHKLLPELVACAAGASLNARLSPSVVVVNVKLRAGQKVWGSGVLVSSDIVATNKHVAGPDFMQIEVQFENGSRRLVAALSEPINGVDLVLLKLAEPTDYAPVSLGGVPEIGAPVTSYGFGLVHPDRTGEIQPLYSSGNVSSVYMGMVYNGQKTAVCSMIVSSASCWNGSSGGGVFNEQNELVGLMASNARDNQDNEVMPDMAFVIPVDTLRLALECIESGQLLDTTESYHHLWRLNPTHVNAKRAGSAATKL